MRLRTGQRNGHTLYLQRGDKPSDDDPSIGFITDPAVARLLCQAASSPWHLNEILVQAEFTEAVLAE